jgi:hypothetical protein
VDPGDDAALAEADAESASVGVAPFLARRAPFAEVLAQPALRQAANATLGELAARYRSLPNRSSHPQGFDPSSLYSGPASEMRNEMNP